MKLKELKAAEALAANLLKDNETQQQVCTSKITQADDLIAQANERMEKAQAAGDNAAYKAAREDRADALVTRELFSGRLDSLKNDPQLAPEDYERITASVISEFGENHEAVQNTIVDAADKLSAAADDLADLANRVNDILHTLQHDIYKDADRKRHHTTGECYDPTDAKTINLRAVSDTIAWAKHGTFRPQYEYYKQNH